MTDLPLVFDGHNDTLLALVKPDAGSERSFTVRSSSGHIDLPRARQGNFGGGFFAIYVPAKKDPERGPATPLPQPPFIAPLPEPLEHDYALTTTLQMAAKLFALERETNGELTVVRTADELSSALQAGKIAAILHIEGAEAISADLHELEVLYQAGLRSIGPVWSRPTIFGHGVPFAYPHSPDTGPGLTDAGKELVRACNRLGIMLDLSHLNEQGFWDVARLSKAPLVATHSNVHAICASSRNLTDKQLDAIRASDGMVGLNFAVSFLRPDGRNERDTPLSVLVDHIKYLVEKLGIDRVGFGSDFDGATMPAAIGDVAGLPALLLALRDAGFNDSELRKIAHENWIRVLRATW